MDLLTVIGFVLVCWLAADFLSGFWHWAEDRYFRSHWPVIGKYIAIPNDRHHEKPAEFLRDGYWQRNYTTMIPAGLLFAMAAPSWWALIFVFVSQANEVHAFAHKKASKWVRTLQEMGVLQCPRHHGVHHRAPNNSHYCVMSNWLNPLLDRLKFWQGMECFLGWLGVRIKKELR